MPPRRRTYHHLWCAVQEALACFAPNVHLIRLPDAHLAADGEMQGTTAHHLTLRHGDVLPLCDRERERLALWFDLFFRVRPAELGRLEV